MKKIVFFDGDGTLWYPEKTRHAVPPVWVYNTDGTLQDKLGQMILVPNAQSVLTQLKETGIRIVILSTHPTHFTDTEAREIIDQKVEHFGISDLCDEVYATRHTYAAKGEKILEVLEAHGIQKDHALMVGDHHEWDYQSARNVGVDALLVRSKYMCQESQDKQNYNILDSLSDLNRHIYESKN